MAAHSTKLSKKVIESKGVSALAAVLNEDQEDDVQAATAWSLGQIGRHSPEHSKLIGCADVMSRLLYLYTNERSSENLKAKAEGALKCLIEACDDLFALEPMLQTPLTGVVLESVLRQCSKILPGDSQGRRSFVTSGGLRRVQEVWSLLEPGSSTAEYVKTINRCFPEELVKFHSPGYGDSLLEKVKNFQPPS